VGEKDQEACEKARTERGRWKGYWGELKDVGKRSVGFSKNLLETRAGPIQNNEGSCRGIAGERLFLLSKYGKDEENRPRGRGFWRVYGGEVPKGLYVGSANNSLYGGSRRGGMGHTS